MCPKLLDQGQQFQLPKHGFVASGNAGAPIRSRVALIGSVSSIPGNRASAIAVACSLAMYISEYGMDLGILHPSKTLFVVPGIAGSIVTAEKSGFRMSLWESYT